MKNTILFLALALLVSNSTHAQISLVGARPNQGSGVIDILKWQAMDSSSVVSYPTSLTAYAMCSSLFDAYNSNYYLTGYINNEGGLFAFNTQTNEQQIVGTNGISNISEIDMSTGKYYTLEVDMPGQITVTEFDLLTGNGEIIGSVPEPGIIGLVVDATGFDSNHGILYYVGDDGSSNLSLFGFHVRDSVLSCTKTIITSTSPGIHNVNGVNYDNEKNTLYVLDRQFSMEYNYLGSYVSEINTESGALTQLGLLNGIDAFILGSSSFDQYSGTYLLVGFDSGFNPLMIAFNTNDNSYFTGFVPDGVSEIVCDNYNYARSTYQVTGEKEISEEALKIFPNPASDIIRIENTPAGSGNISMILRDLNGKEAFRSETKNSQRIDLDIRNIPAGIYSLQLQNSSATRSAKIMVLK